MERALVTGGAGFLGSHVAEHLLGMGLRVVVLDDMSGGYRRNVPAGCELCEGSIEDDALVSRLFESHRFDYVFHLAAYAAEALSHFIRRFNYANNLIGSANLINAAVNHGVQCFVYTSSIAVYGNSSPPFTEEAAPCPADPYGIAKLAVEQDLRAAGELFGLRHVIFRPHNVYGERQNLADPYRNVIGIFIRQILEGRPCTVFGDGSQVRAFSHVDDVAPLIARAARTPGAVDQVFNVGADDACSIRDLAELLQKVLQRDVGIEDLPARHESHRAFADHGHAGRVFGHRPSVDLESGLRRMVAWARGIEIGPARSAQRIEISRKLPSAWASLVRNDRD